MRRLIFLLALLCASPALAQPATTTAPGSLATSPYTLQPISRSQTGWTNTGGRFANPSVTLTDTSTGAGTVANGYTDLFSGDTIATQTNAVTFTNYYGSYFSAPVAGTHVTMTNKWALGADSAKINGALSLTGAITATGLSNGTQTSCLGLSSGNAFVLSTGACGGSITAGTTPTSGITSGDFISSSSNLVIDSGVAVPLAPSTYWYPYGAGNAGCYANPTCAIPTGQSSAPANTYKGTSANGLAYLWDSNRWVNANSVFGIEIDTNSLGITDGNSSIPSQSISGKTFSLHFTSASIPGSPVTVTYTGTGSDTVATVATNLCNAVIANTSVTNTNTEMVCDANQGGGGFNLQWSVNAAVTVTSTGTGTITLVNTPNQLDGVFSYHIRAPGVWVAHANDLYWCDIYSTHQTCGYTIENVAANGIVSEFLLTTGSQTFGISEGVVVGCGGTGDAKFAGVGTLNISNSGCANSGALFFASNTGAPDARIYENATNAFLMRMGSANSWVLSNNASTVVADYNVHAVNTLTISAAVEMIDLPTSGSNLVRLCMNSVTGALSAGSGC